MSQSDNRLPYEIRMYTPQGRPLVAPDKKQYPQGCGFPLPLFGIYSLFPVGWGLARALRSAKRKVQAMQKTVRILHASLQKSRPVHFVHGAGCFNSL